MPLLAINHHYYREFVTGRGIHPTTPRMLSKEVLKIRAAGWRIGTEDDIFAFLSGRLAADDKVAILTFNDGLAEQMAAPRQLEAHGASAIFYVPTAPIVDHIVLDVHKLQMIRARVEDAQIAIELDKTSSFGKTDYDDDLLAIQYRYDDELARKVKYFLNFTLDHDARQAWTNEYFATLFGAEREVSASLYMSSDDLRRLSEKRLLSSHAHSHLPLATLCAHRMQYELSHSRRLNEETTDSVPLVCLIHSAANQPSGIMCLTAHLPADTCMVHYGAWYQRSTGQGKPYGAKADRHQRSGSVAGR